MNVFRLMRPKQWYKNLVIYIAIVFTGQLYNPVLFDKTLLGFISLCLLSSATYVINDIFDKKTDKLHPEKKKRPIASGEVSIGMGVFLAMLLSVAGVTIASWLDTGFLLVVMAFFALSQIYTIWLKNAAFADITVIGVNFVLRALSGVVLLRAEISPWLIVTAFFLAVFLALGKRRSDAGLLGKRAVKHRKVHKYYKLKLVDSLINAVMGVIIISYSLYTFLKAERFMIITLPVVVYALFRYKRLIHDNRTASPERAVMDIRILLSIAAWGAIVFIAHYR